MDNYLKTLLDNFCQALENDPVVVDYKAARDAYAKDTATTQAVNEYNVQRMLLDEQQLAPERDEVLIESLQNRVNALYEKLMGAESMKTLAVAENKLNELLNEVNQTIMAGIIPESSCGGDCGHCHGCH